MSAPTLPEADSWRRALRAVLVPALASRALVWTAGVVAMLVRTPSRTIDPPGVIAHIGHAANIAAAPALRWDAVWYLAIAEHGYGSASPDFFPLYPLGIRGLDVVTRSAIVAGLILSLAAFVAALCVLYRLVELDFGARVASTTVWLVALFPMSLFFYALYTESLFLALSAGSLYAARTGRWALAGLLGGLATATRNVGVLLVVPLVALFLQSRRRQVLNLGWIALVPAGLGAYVIGSAISRGSPFAMFNSKAADRGFVLAPVTVVKQLEWTIDKIHSLSQAGRSDLIPLGSGLVEIGFLALAVAAAIGVIRRLDLPYAAYAVVMLLVLLCEPVIHGNPLTSFPRYILVLFPLWIWLALFAAERPRAKIAVFATSVVLLVGFTAQFATWRFVA